jgi:C-terminal processing protease CtpA/Prc
MTSRTILILTFGIGILIGAVALWIFRDPQKGPRAEAAWAEAQQEEARAASALSESTHQPATEFEVRRLRKELARERELRKQLTLEIEVYEARLAVIQQERSELDAAADAAEEPLSRKKMKTAMEEQLERFGDQALRAEGFADNEIEGIQRRWEQSVMEKEEMANLRARGKPLPDGVGFNEIRDSMREDLGDDGYDAMLFATNQTNRVVVSSLLESSPAYKAGLRTGDVIYSYDNQRVFKPMILDQLAREAEPGETRKVEVLEGNNLSTIYIETGPTGAIFGSAVGRPMNY